MDIANLLKLLNENKVSYIIIGATAFPLHGYARATLDIDFFIEPTPENADRTLRALKQFGYDTTDLSSQDLVESKTLIRGYMVETDIHPFVTGIKSFKEVWAKKISSELEGVPTNFVDLDTLIQMKEAAGRPKDLEDLKFLLEIKKQK